MDTIKSIAVPVTRRDAIAKARRTNRPETHDDAQAPTINEFRRQQPLATTTRPMHRYRVGQRLAMARGSRDIARAFAACLVTALVPHETGPLLYRVRSETESFERIVDEIDLAPLL